MPTAGYSVPAPNVVLSSKILTDPTGMNDSLSYNVAVTREISIGATVKSAAGSARKTWKQSLSYKYAGAVNADGLVQSLSQISSGTDESLSAGKSVYTRNIDYPLFLNATAAGVYVNRTQDISIMGEPVLPSGLQPFDVMPGSPTFQSSNLSTTQDAFQLGVGGVESTGDTYQSMTFTGTQTGSDGKERQEDFSRLVNAVNGMIIEDSQTLGTSTISQGALGAAPTAFPASYQLLLGRTPFRKSN